MKINSNKFILKSIITSLVFLSFSGCLRDDAKSSGIETYTVSGSVTKGKVASGSVVLYQNDGVTLLGRDDSIEDGNYSIDIGSYIGSIKAVATIVSYEDESKLSTITQVSDLELDASSYVNASDLIVNISAITDIASDLLGDISDKNQSTIEEMNKYVASMVGIGSVDLTKEAPTLSFSNDQNLSNTASIKYGAALLAVANDSNTSGVSDGTTNKTKVIESIKRLKDSIVNKDIVAIETYIEGNLQDANMTIDSIGTNLINSAQSIEQTTDVKQLLSLAKIANYADNNTNPAPTVQDYIDAGVTGVDTNNLNAVNAQVDVVTKLDADTVPEVQALVTSANDALAKIEAYNNGDGTTPSALTLQDYSNAGITGVTTNNLNAVNAQVLAQAIGGADTVPEVQALVTSANNALAKIESYNNGDGTTPPALTVADYEAAGITGVDSINLNALNALVLAESTGGADTVPEIQALANAADVVAPTISGVVFSSVPAYSAYKTGDSIDVNVTFDENVIVSGTPQITLTIGSASKTATYQSGTGSRTLLFTYTVQSGDNDSDGIALVANSLSLNSGTIRDGASNDANLTHSGITTDSTRKVDNIIPAIALLSFVNTTQTGDDGYAKEGDIIELIINFSEDLNGTLPTVTIAGHSVTVTNAGDSNASTYKATYTLQSSDSEGNISVSVSNYYDIAINSGVAVSTTTDNSNIIYDITNPVITLASTSITQVENNQTIITISATDANGIYSYSTNNGADDGDVDVDGTSGIVTFKPSVEPDYERPSDSNSDNIYQIQLNAKDKAGNIATQAITVTITNDANESGTAPITLSVRFDDANATGTLGDKLLITYNTDIDNTKFFNPVINSYIVTDANGSILSIDVNSSEYNTTSKIHTLILSENSDINLSVGDSVRLANDGVRDTSNNRPNNYSDAMIPLPLPPFAGGTFNNKTYGLVTSSRTQRVWLDRNLGADRVCTSETDHQCYGSLFQWGRGADGHELINWTSSTVGTPVNNSITTTTQSWNATGNSVFITANNWANDDSLATSRAAFWSKTDGYGICPSGFRVPTSSELDDELPENRAQLNLPIAGSRAVSNGEVLTSGQYGNYWSTDIYGYAYDAKSSYYTLDATSAQNPRPRLQFTNWGVGLSVRCIKHIEQGTD